MAKVILICGKICSGKTSYALSMMKHQSMVLLSSDELISALFHPNENEFERFFAISLEYFGHKKRADFSAHERDIPY